MGDLILSTPAIATVRRSFPDAHITMLCSEYNAVVMERNTDVDETVALDAQCKPAAFGAQFQNQLDIAIALAPLTRDFTIVGATRAKQRVGYTYARRYLSRLTAGFYLTELALSSADPALCEKHPERPVIHEVEQLLNVVALAGARERIPDLRIDITDADRDAVAFLPESPVVFHLGVRWFTKGSTLENALQIISELREFGLPVVVTYGPECNAQAAAIRDAGSADAVVGGLSFHQWAAAFERAACIVTVDTGATHVASAMRRPTVVAFEHRYFRLSSQEWAPYRVAHALVRKPAAATPASLAQLRRDVHNAVASLL
ncbi:MAG: glycosyltransferase family 9 protein [Candidatus Eremiobacteraeota bacterium]|nr:glycosyltransferase family 9 protein [Candidatus Eremiobacteraeota bacterium]